VAPPLWRAVGGFQNWVGTFMGSLEVRLR
jgi:hypothetical protein